MNPHPLIEEKEQAELSGTWIRTRMFDPEKVRKLTKTPLPIKIRLMLKFKRKFYVEEENMIITYKDYKGVRYILSIEEKEQYDG